MNRLHSLGLTASMSWEEAKAHLLTLPPEVRPLMQKQRTRQRFGSPAVRMRIFAFQDGICTQTEDGAEYYSPTFIESDELFRSFQLVPGEELPPHLFAST